MNLSKAAEACKPEGTELTFIDPPAGVKIGEKADSVPKFAEAHQQEGDARQPAGKGGRGSDCLRWFTYEQSILNKFL